MQTQFLSAESRLWHDCLAGIPHDFYHLPGYVQLCAQQEGGSAVAFLAQEGSQRLFLPLIVRPIESEGTTGGTLFDAASPYGYPSPLVSGSASEEQRADFLERAVLRLLAELRSRDVVSLFVRLHPLLPVPPAPLCRQGMLIEHGETVFIDLTRPEEQIWHETRGQHKTHIKRAQRDGYVAEIDDQWQHLDAFIDLYTETMHRVHAGEYYLFPPRYFYQLRDALAGALHLVVVRLGTTVACAGLFSEVCGIVQYHLSGRRLESTASAPGKLMIDFVRRWATQRGNRVFHLGGGLGAHRDSLFDFKFGFSKLQGHFQTWRVIINAHAYQALVARWQQTAGDQAAVTDDFFPAYRRPLLRTQAV